MVLETNKTSSPDRDWNKTLLDGYGPVQPWLSSLAQKEDLRESFNELMDTPLDFSTFVMNQLKVDTLTSELLTGPTFELIKGSCKSLVELEYLFEEVYKATTKQLDWNNPEEYLSGGISSRIYATSVTKTKATDYGHIKWIEDLVPNRMWSQVPVSYDKHALWEFHIRGENNNNSMDLLPTRNLLMMSTPRMMKLYKFKEGDFNRLRIQDIEDMMFLLVQGKLANLTVEERLAFNVSLRMFTRSVVIQRRVEDLQLGVKSYQKKLNLTKPDTYKPSLKRREAYTTYSNPRGFIYLNKVKKNRLMHIDELHKFSDGTLNDVWTVLNDHLKGIQMEYLPQTIWRQSDKDKAGAMIQAIDKQLKTKRIMQTLEKFVGGRPLYGDNRFYTLAGNLVKGILLKLNLPDHRYLKMEVKNTKVVSEGRFTAKLVVPSLPLKSPVYHEPSVASVVSASVVDRSIGTDNPHLSLGSQADSWCIEHLRYYLLGCLAEHPTFVGHSNLLIELAEAMEAFESAEDIKTFKDMIFAL
ncbi:hypothetical protein Tco_0000473 [Tanacetum coccineum]